MLLRQQLPQLLCSNSLIQQSSWWSKLMPPKTAWMPASSKRCLCLLSTYIRQTNDALIKNEVLDTMFTMQKYRKYVFGVQVVTHPDHNPLEAIFSKPISKSSVRLQRMVLQPQHQNTRIVCIKGKNMFIADALSRATITTSQEDRCSPQLKSNPCNYTN